MNKLIEIHHIVDADVWARAVDAGIYAPDSLDDEGFVHFSRTAQVPGTLKRYYADVENLVLVTFDAASFGDDLVFEATVSDEEFPHVYSTIDPSHAISVLPATGWQRT